MKRWLLKIAVFAVFMALLHVGTLHPSVLEGVRAADPFLFLANCFTWTAAGFGAVSLAVGLVTLGLCVWNRRFFCRWVCPLGFLQDVLRLVRRILHAPAVKSTRKTLGPFLAALTFLGLFFGGFTFLFLEPLVVLDGAHHVPWARWLLGLIGILVLFSPNFWCWSVCPCGGAQEILFRLNPKAWRKPAKSGSEDETPTAQTVSKSRRAFLLTASVGVCAGAWALMKHSVGKILTAVRLRPPGAVEESAFLARCTRCGACEGACPTGLITTLKDLGSPALYGTPTLDFTPKNAEGRVFCDENCTACGNICPTGALKKIRPEEKKNLRIARCEMTFDLCRRAYQKECSICIQECPFGAMAEVWSEEQYAKIPTVNPDLCTGCGKCVAYCPGEPLRVWDPDLGDFTGGDQTTGKKALSISEELGVRS